jgi:hypothetical protein
MQQLLCEEGEALARDPETVVSSLLSEASHDIIAQLGVKPRGVIVSPTSAKTTTNPGGHLVRNGETHRNENSDPEETNGPVSRLSERSAANSQESTLLSEFLAWHRNRMNAAIDLLAYQSERAYSFASGSSDGPSGHDSGHILPEQQGKDVGNKRKRGAEEQEGSGEGCKIGVDSKRRQLEAKEKFLACPYFQHNPQKYSSQRSCPGPGWPTVHRVKYVSPHRSYD